MSKRQRPQRRERKNLDDLKQEIQKTEQTQSVTGLIYPEITEELVSFYESNPAYHLDTLPIIYHTAQHQDDIDEALARMILLTQEVYSGTDKEVEVHRSFQNNRAYVIYIGLKDRIINKSSTKETIMADQNQTPEQQPEASAEEVKEQSTTEEKTVKTSFDELWDKMAAACEKDGLPDMNVVDYSDSSILGQINALVLHDEIKGRHFAEGEHRMANIIATISDPELVNMIPYIHHVGAMTDPEYYDKDYTQAVLKYDFGEYGAITFLAEQYDSARHPAHLKNYASVMRMLKEGQMADNLLIKPEHQASIFNDHRMYATVINRVHLAHWAFKQVTKSEQTK